jgi:hypothetical protein
MGEGGKLEKQEERERRNGWSRPFFIEDGMVEEGRSRSWELDGPTRTWARIAWEISHLEAN